MAPEPLAVWWELMTGTDNQHTPSTGSAPKLNTRRETSLSGDYTILIMPDYHQSQNSMLVPAWPVLRGANTPIQRHISQISFSNNEIAPWPFGPLLVEAVYTEPTVLALTKVTTEGVAESEQSCLEGATRWPLPSLLTIIDQCPAAF